MFNRYFIIFNIAFIFLLMTTLAPAADQPAQQKAQAVESVGEINAKDNSNGTVIAGLESDLILTLIADMSQAEPGEEIESIQITMPLGFVAQSNAVKSVKVGEENVPNFKSAVDRNRIIVTLPTLITFTTVVDIEFTVEAPSTPSEARSFVVGILNVFQNPILVAIKSQNADGRINNDTLTVKVAAATKPDPPTGLSTKPDTSGENDLILSWTKSSDSVVSGYLVYRADKADDPFDVPGAQSTSYVDRNLEPGEYSYTIRSYKTKVLKSDASNTASGIAPEDTKTPEPPVMDPVAKVIERGVEINWEPSSSGDVVEQIVYRGSSINDLNQIESLGADAFAYVDENPPTAGSYVYVIGAIDESGNESKSFATQPRQALSGAEPQPNPFTPLSADSRYNQITFPASVVEGGEGVFSIRILDLEGDLVFEEEAGEGSKEIKWNGKDQNGEYVNSGIYIYQATMGNRYKIGSIIVAK